MNIFAAFALLRLEMRSWPGRAVHCCKSCDFTLETCARARVKQARTEAPRPISLCLPSLTTVKLIFGWPEMGRGGRMATLSSRRSPPHRPRQETEGSRPSPPLSFSLSLRPASTADGLRRPLRPCGQTRTTAAASAGGRAWTAAVRTRSGG